MLAGMAEQTPYDPAPDWGVVATISEPPVLARTFAAWHLGLGAREVHIFLDTQDPEAEVALADLPGAFVTTCDAAFWAASPEGRRPPALNRRQALNAARVHEAGRVEWLLHCDADEFVADGTALARALIQAPPEARALRLLPLERVRRAGVPAQALFDGTFRRPAADFERWGEESFGRWAKFLVAGVTGHAIGKTIFRRGAVLRPGIHFVRNAADEIVDDGRLPDLLLHFDGLTPTHYLLKLAARMELPHFNRPNGPDRPGRSRQARFVKNNLGDAKRLATFVDGVQSLGPAQEEALRHHGRLADLSFDPTPALARFGPAPDLSVAAFDAALHRRYAALIAETGLALPETAQ